MVKIKDSKDKKSKGKPKKKKKRLEDFNWDYVIIDVENVMFTLEEKRAHKEMPMLAKLILTRARAGDTLGMILFDVRIPESKWLPYLKKHDELKVAIADASVYHKAFGERLLFDMARGKKNHSPQMAKLLMDSFYDIRQITKDLEPKDKINKAALMKEIATLLPG